MSNPSKSEFFKPQQQSRIGIILIFSTTLYQVGRNLWVLGVYFLVGEISPLMMLFAAIGLGVILVLAFLYSIFYYLKFIFFIDEEKQAFVLQKGVFTSSTVNISFDKIQQVNFKRDILQKIFGVYSVVIDTAGSQEKEVEIKALSAEKAEILSQLLMTRSLSAKESTTESFSEENQNTKVSEEITEWEYKNSIASLLKIGLTSNYLRGLVILLAFYVNLRAQFNQTELGYGQNLPMEISEAVMPSVVMTLLILVGLLIVGLIITLGETFIKYYGLHLQKTGAGLQVEMGLKNNTRVNIRAPRLQLLQEITNPLQKRLNLYKIKISLASSQNALSKNQIKIPGLPRSIVEKTKSYFYGQVAIEEKYQIIPEKVLLIRNISRGLLPLLLAWIFLRFSQFVVPEIWVFGLSLCYILILIGYHYFYFKTIRLSVSDNFLVKQFGLWNRKKQFIEMYKLQAVSVSRTIWYRENLVNLTFHSAGGDISYKLVNRNQAIQLMDYLLYKIESSRKDWM